MRPMMKFKNNERASWAERPVTARRSPLAGVAEEAAKAEEAAGILAVGVHRGLGRDATECRGISGCGEAKSGDDVARIPPARRRGIAGATAELGDRGE